MKLEFSPKDCLEASVAEIIGGDHLPEKLSNPTGQPLRVKLGIDPTSPDLHIGRSIPLWRLRAFQELGHEIHLIIGDFTGQVGDTSDKDSERPMLEKDQVQANLQRYEEQLWLILNPERRQQVHFHYNSEWLEPLMLAQLSRMADAFSMNAFVKRELIARRLEAGSRVSLREVLYPLMQGYDSVVVQADIELGGTDQRFNLLAGRILQEQAGQPAQAIIMNQLISGTDGRKMSSSWGNVIRLLDTPADKFGKVMASLDSVMAEYLLALPLSVRPYTTQQLEERLAGGENPRDLKLELASALVRLYHGEEEAVRTREQFIAQFSEHQKPADILEVETAGGEQLLTDFLVEQKLAPSKNEARRLIDQGGVRVNDEKIIDPYYLLKKDKGVLIQVGKRVFRRLK